MKGLDLQSLDLEGARWGQGQGPSPSLRSECIHPCSDGFESRAQLWYNPKKRPFPSNFYKPRNAIFEIVIVSKHWG